MAYGLGAGRQIYLWWNMILSQSPGDSCPANTIMLKLALLLSLLQGIRPDVLIDLSKAKLDEESGNYCVIQKVTKCKKLKKNLINGAGF